MKDKLKIEILKSGTKKWNTD